MSISAKRCERMRTHRPVAAHEHVQGRVPSENRLRCGGQAGGKEQALARKLIGMCRHRAAGERVASHAALRRGSRVAWHTGNRSGASSADACAC